MVAAMPVSARLITLSRDGTCDGCRRPVPRGEQAWWVPGKATVTCLTCRREPAATAPVAAVAAAPTTTPYDPNHASQLPFTGADVRPLAIVGGILILMGIYILTTLEQRRRAMRRMAYAMRTSEAAGRATRITRWFLGD